MTESEAKKEIEHNVFCNTDNFEMTISKECYKTIINALNKQIARKPNKTIDKTCSIQNEVNVCPVCNYYLTPIHFIPIDENKVKGTDKVSYCEICGQKIDYNE